jgi:hypothetical protein
MNEQQGQIIAGILGQWASRKSTATSTLVNHLGGEGEVIFIDDRAMLAGQAVKHILELDKDQVKVTVEEDGSQRFEGEFATVYLNPGEDLRTVDLSQLLFDLHDGDQAQDLPTWCTWFYAVREALGAQIRERSAEGKPIVIEAGFGTNTEQKDDNPFCHTIAYLCARLEDQGVRPNDVMWIIIEASYETRSERNQKRPDTVPAIEFDRFAADGGDLEPEQERRLVDQGVSIRRVPNEHNDVEKFKADVIAAFEGLFEGRLVQF